MKSFARIAFSLLLVVLFLAAVMFIVAAANFMPGWAIIPLGVPAAAATFKLFTE